MSDDRLMNHKLHIIITFITFGVWWPFYGLMFILFKLSGSTIEKRRIKRAGAREKRRIKRAKTKEDRRITQKLVEESSSKGYKYRPVTGIKKKSFLVSAARTYSLSCNHQVRAKNIKLIGKTVWCDVCNDHREVTGAIWAQY